MREFEIDVFDFPINPPSQYPQTPILIGELDAIPTQTLDCPVKRFGLPKVPPISQFLLSVEEVYGMETLSFMTEPAASWETDEWIHGRLRDCLAMDKLPARFGLAPNIPTRLVRLGFKSTTVVDLMSVGRSGKRAVWLERTVETNEYRLMKTTFESDASSSPLLPPGMVLPFKLETCTALFLHEAKGQVLLGSYTGHVYILSL